MRFKSEKLGGYQVYAVTGTNTVSFAIDFRDADTTGLLGFAIERHDPTEGERYYLYGFKVFPSVYPEPTPDLSVSTYDQPVQSFVYDDFTAKPGREYTYWFHPLAGRPKALDRSAEPVPIAVRTELAFSTNEHDVFFNRGVAGSQAYARRFGNRPPDTLPAAQRQRALAWLSRDLDEALLRFIASAAPGDALFGCFYEFHYAPVLQAFQAARGRGVEVRLIVDMKRNPRQAPRKKNVEAIEAAGLDEAVVPREARTNAIAHNKFIVLLKGEERRPAAVWTGSTNLSHGAIHGHANVGHCVRNEAVAARYAAYWRVLVEDPGATDDMPAGDARRSNTAFRRAVQRVDEALPDLASFPVGITPIFSPRENADMLAMYAQLLDAAQDLACVTLAFTVADAFKTLLADNTRRDALTFLLLEKEDKPKPGKEEVHITLSAQNNTYSAFGAFIDDPLHRWAQEVTAQTLGLNKAVLFIHSKFLLKDPLGADPIVVTGSANFSDASIRANDENMLLIRGNRRVADIYYTEFNRLFNHYYFRSVRKKLAKQENNNEGSNEAENDGGSRFLREDDGWLAKYQRGSLRYKRAAVFWKMAGIEPA